MNIIKHSKEEIELINNANNLRQDVTKQLTTLCEVNSGSYNYQGIEKCRDLLCQYAQPLNASISYIETKQATIISPHGEEITTQAPKLLRISKNTQAKHRVLLCGHIDTVFSKDHVFQKGKYLSKDILNAPGSADMKGGILVMLHALMLTQKYIDLSDFGFEIILNTDEEIGSAGSRDILYEQAKWAHFACVYEPSMPDGTLAGARKGSGNFDIVVQGRPAHAGRDHRLGRNAIIKACLIANKLSQLTDYAKENTLNVAKIDGGDVNNMVPQQAIIRFNIRCKSNDESERLIKIINEIIQCEQDEDYKIKLFGGMTRPPKEMTKKQQNFFKQLKAIGASIDQDISWKDTGGVCDGNNIAKAGIPVIDTLGVIGGNIHTKDEYIDLTSLEKRILLSALLFSHTARGKLLV